jgi:hypothetical protein
LRQKPLSPDRESHIEVRLKGTNVKRTTAYINNTETPPLCAGWQIHVKNYIRKILECRHSDGELCCIESNFVYHLEIIIGVYVSERISRIKPFTWDDLTSELETLENASLALLNILSKLTHSNPVWIRIERHDPRLNLANARAMIIPLVEAAHTASLRAKTEKAEGKGLTYTGPWNNLIMALADLFEAIDLKATAAKASRAKNPKPSLFVEFVWMVMTNAVPQLVREHVTGTQSSMAGEVSKVLAERRKPTATTQLRGSFTKFRRE